MPLFKTIPLTDGMIGVWQLSEKSEEILLHFSSEELSDPGFQQYTFEKRKVEWLAIRLLIKELIGSDFSISYSETGKPILIHAGYQYISISHSRDFAVVFIHKYSNIGIDIESTERNYHSIEKRYLSEEERIQVDKNPVLQCLYWCAKEAVFKLVADEGIEFKQQIHISPFNPETEDQFSVKYLSGENESQFQAHFQLFSDHGLVWVTSEN